jgi:hypothetical protein
MPGTPETYPPTCVILTNGNVFARVILEPIFADPRWRVTGVVRITGDYLGQTGWRSAWWLARRTAVPYLAYKLALAVTYSVARWFGASAAQDVEAIARMHNVPVMHAQRVSDFIVTKFITERTPDVLVSVSCPQHIPQAILDCQSCLREYPLVPAPGLRWARPVFLDVGQRRG